MLFGPYPFRLHIIYLMSYQIRNLQGFKCRTPRGCITMDSSLTVLHQLLFRQYFAFLKYDLDHVPLMRYSFMSLWRILIAQFLVWSM